MSQTKFIPKAFTEEQTQKMFDNIESKLKELGIEELKNVTKERDEDELKYTFKHTYDKTGWNEEHLIVRKAVSCSGFNTIARIEFRVSGHCNNGIVKISPRNVKSLDETTEQAIVAFKDSIKNKIEVLDRKEKAENEEKYVEKTIGLREAKEKDGTHTVVDLPVIGTVKGYISMSETTNGGTAYGVRFDGLKADQVLAMFKKLRS